MQYIKFESLSKKDKKSIEVFLQLQNNNCYFQSILFFNACQLTPLLTPYYYIAYEEKQIIGSLLVFTQAQYSFFPLNILSARNIIWGEPVVLNNNPEIHNGLYDAYLKDKPLSIYTQVRNLCDQSLHKPSLQQLGFVYEDHLNILVDLQKTQDELWKDVDTKRRNEIRRAIREGTIFEADTSLVTLYKCYNILVEVYQRAKLPLPQLSHFEALLQENSENEGLKIFVALYEEKVIGCMFCLACGDTLFDYYAGAYSIFYKKYPNDLIPWEVFKWAKENGFKHFDFGGAGKPDVPYGVRDYKKKFGGVLVNYGRFEKIHFPLLYSMVLRAFKLWKTMKKNDNPI